MHAVSLIVSFVAGRARPLLELVAGAALYGFAAGFGHDLHYASRDMVKFPLLLLVTASVGATSAWLVALLLGLELGFMATQRLAVALFRDVAVLLGSLAPIVFFLACVGRGRGDDPRGEYDLFLGSNMAAIALCGTLALLRQVRRLSVAGTISRTRARAIALLWLTLWLLVGGQAAFWMRPFFGYPATRGVRAPWFLGEEPDLRGATNFFEAVAQFVRREAMPADLEQRIGRLGRSAEPRRSQRGRSAELRSRKASRQR
ncbi:MAG: hypothetical protein EXS13_08735 [Planctomycetes bacterium]|nr:hypothetical protein [Planctomycetota bacterium]